METMRSVQKMMVVWVHTGEHTDREWFPLTLPVRENDKHYFLGVKVEKTCKQTNAEGTKVNCKRALTCTCPLLRKLHQQFNLYKDQVKKLGEEPQAAQMSRAESPTCGVCRKTKFADGCGRACCYCESRFCARCGGRVPLRANKVRESLVMR